MIWIKLGSHKGGPLAENFLPCDARLEHRFGKSRMALNQQVLRFVLSTFTTAKISVKYLKPLFSKLLSTLPKSTYQKRTSRNDQQVIKFIHSELAKHEQRSHTNLLRKYRQSGNACEQKRFRSLFLIAKSKLK